MTFFPGGLSMKVHGEVEMIEKALDEIAERILMLDEASLSGLLEKYRLRMEAFEPSKNWEKSVILFFVINAVRAKNHLFNAGILKRRDTEGNEAPGKDPDGKTPPYLKRVK